MGHQHSTRHPSISSPEQKAYKWAYSIPMLWHQSLVCGSSVHNFRHLLLPNCFANQSQSSYGASLGRENESLLASIWFIWPRMPPCPYIGRNPSNIFRSSEQISMKLGMYHQDSSPSWFIQMITWVYLDLFYGKVKFFSIGKSKNSGFFRNYCSLWPESCNMQTTNWVNEGMWAFKVKIISGPWPKVIYIWYLKLFFFQKSLGYF